MEVEVEDERTEPNRPPLKEEMEREDTLWSKIEKKRRQNSHPIIHCPTSKGVSEVNERASTAEGASEVSSPQQANE